MLGVGALLSVVIPFSLPQTSSALPLPRMSVPATEKPPKLDGILSPGEWDRSSACTGFVTAFEGKLAKIQSTAWLTYDSQYLYVAFRNVRGPALSFISARARRNDDDAIVYDPANEVWFSPPGTPQVTYQSMFNVFPAVQDTKFIPSLGYSSRAWSGKWEVASHQDRESWTVEARAPISAFGLEHIADGTIWGSLFTTDVIAEPDKFRAWAPGGAFADVPRHGVIEFSGHGPAFQLLKIDSVFSGKPAIEAAVVGPAQGSANIRVTSRFGPGIAPGPGDVVQSKDVSVAAGSTQKVQFSADLVGAALRSGYAEITASAGSNILYHQVFPFVADGSSYTPPAVIATTPYDQPFGLTASYAPLSKALIVNIDRHYMPSPGSVAGGRVELVEAATGRAVAQSAVGEFNRDYSEFSVDLKKVPVPVETDADWESLHVRQPLGGVNRMPSPTALNSSAAYQLKAVLTDKAGAVIASAAVPVKLQGLEFPWLPNNIGISDRTIAPWTPIRVAGSAVSLWNKTYSMTGAGTASHIVNSGLPQLSGPMVLEAVIDGHRTTLSSGDPNPVHLTEASVELKGEAHAPNLTVNTDTTIEFDGFVSNSMTVQPTRANVSALSLVVTMPAAEGAFFVTTSGGWSSYFGDTPAKWDSRESSLPAISGNFVPYVFLTDSERGFSVFADNEKGWRLDPSQPTQELTRRDGLVTLRIHFITKSGPIEQPLSIHYGWMVTPQKPQPAGWRGYLIENKKYFPQSTPVFWNEADWNVAWPYYSSPFPHSYDKSRTLLNATTTHGVVGCVGNIAHAIARYSDYRGRSFAAFASDWASIPGNISNGDVARSRGPNDFDLYHFDRWSKLSGLGCIYFDENYLAEDWNYLTGGAYRLPNGQVQPGYDYLGLREYNKRLRYMFHDNGKPAPNLWEHTTGGQAVYAWMPDVSMDGENVEPTDLVNDYIEILPSSRLRSIGMGRNLGSAPFIMCQANRHGKGEVSKALVHQFVGWTLAHDVLPEGVGFWPPLAAELELWRDDVRFVPWWVKGSGLESATAGILASAHVRPGSAVIWVVNTNREDKSASLRIDAKRLGLDPGQPIQAYDAEDGSHYALEGGVLSLSVPKRMWRAVRLTQPRLLGRNTAFVADFNREVAATEAWGARYPLGDSLPQPVADGKSGSGAAIDTRLAFAARHHVSSAEGSISLDVRLGTPQNGTLITVGGLRLQSVNGGLSLQGTGIGSAKPATAARIGDGAWHSVTLRWTGRNVQVLCDGQVALAAELGTGLLLPGMGHGSEIRDEKAHVEPAQVVFGPLHAVIDNLRMGNPEFDASASAAVNRR